MSAIVVVSNVSTMNTPAPKCSAVGIPVAAENEAEARVSECRRGLPDQADHQRHHDRHEDQQRRPTGWRRRPVRHGGVLLRDQAAMRARAASIGGNGSVGVAVIPAVIDLTLPGPRVGRSSVGEDRLTRWMFPVAAGLSGPAQPRRTAAARSPSRWNTTAR